MTQNSEKKVYYHKLFKLKKTMGKKTRSNVISKTRVNSPSRKGEFKGLMEWSRKRGMIVPVKREYWFVNLERRRGKPGCNDHNVSRSILFVCAGWDLTKRLMYEHAKKQIRDLHDNGYIDFNTWINLPGNKVRKERLGSTSIVVPKKATRDRRYIWFTLFKMVNEHTCCDYVFEDFNYVAWLAPVNWNRRALHPDRKFCFAVSCQQHVLRGTGPSSMENAFLSLEDAKGSVRRRMVATMSQWYLKSARPEMACPRHGFTYRPNDKDKPVDIPEFDDADEDELPIHVNWSPVGKQSVDEYEYWVTKVLLRK